jgi:hypothetical protein
VSYFVAFLLFCFSCIRVTILTQRKILMTSKPIVYLWSLGESAHQASLVDSFPKSAKLDPKDALSALSTESEARRYHLTTSLYGAAQQPTGAVLTYGATQTITPKLKSVLLMASCYVSEVVVLLVGVSAIKTEKALDQIESNLRKNLSEMGFDGNAATVLRVQKEKAELALLLSALDEKQLLIEPLKKPRVLPKNHPNADRAKLLLQTRLLVREATLVIWKNDITAEELPRLPLSTRVGGMPYLPKTEDWPTCKTCKSKLKFLWQIDARAHLRPMMEGAGLYVFYFCDSISHYDFYTAFALVKHYPEPKEEHRQSSRREAKAKLRAKNAPTSARALGFATRLEIPARAELMTNKKTYPGYWSLLADVAPKTKAHKKNAYLRKRANDKFDFVLYEEMFQSFGAQEPISFDEVNFSIGGYSALDYSQTIPKCTTCKKSMRTLLNVADSPSDYCFSERLRGMNAFVCGCSPDDVSVLFRDRFDPDDERYDEDWE